MPHKTASYLRMWNETGSWLYFTGSEGGVYRADTRASLDEVINERKSGEEAEVGWNDDDDDDNDNEDDDAVI